MDNQTNGWTDRWTKRDKKSKGAKNRSPKGNLWSAIPVALLCMVVNRNDRKQGSGTEGDEIL